MASSTANSTRPSWVHDGVVTSQPPRYMNEAEYEAQGMLRVMTFGTRAPKSAKEKYGDWVVDLEKVIAAKVDRATNKVWIRFDRVFSGNKPTEVLINSIWREYMEFKTNFPRAQKEYIPDGSSKQSRACTIVNPKLDGDDDEEGWFEFAAGDPEDRQDSAEMVNLKQTSRVMDEDSIRFEWWKTFGDSDF